MISRLSAYYYNLGLTQIAEKNFAAAIEQLKKSVCWHPGNQNAWNLLGLCYYRAGRLPMARYCWTESLRNRGSMDMEPYAQTEEGLSGSYFLNLLEQDDTVSNLAKVVELAGQGEYKAALQYWKEKKMPAIPSPQLITYAGILEYLAGNSRQAKEDWISALKMDPSDERPAAYLEYMDGLSKGTWNRIKAKLSEMHRRLGRKG